MSVHRLVLGLVLVVSVPLSARAQCPPAPSAADPAEAFVPGLDVSHYQGSVRWAEVGAAGVRFAYVKATEGLGGPDPEFAANWAGARSAGLLRGAYHFFRPGDPAGAQAENFLARVGPLDALDLPPALDVEVADHAAPEAVADSVVRWLEVVEKATGKRPLLYTGSWFGGAYLRDARLARYPLWIAAYGADPTALPGAWQGRSWAFWQHSEHGAVRGIDGPVDLDSFRGSLADLRRFACAESAAP